MMAKINEIYLLKFIGMHSLCLQGDDVLYVSDQISVSDFSFGSIGKVININGEHAAISCHNGNLWLGTNVHGSRSLSGQEGLPFFLSNPQDFGEGWAIGFGRGRSPRRYMCLYKFDVSSEIKKEVSGLSLSGGDGNFFATYTNGDLFVFDSNLSVLWSQSLDASAFSSDLAFMSNRPFFFQDKVVVNAGLTLAGGEIKAFVAKSGDLAWSFKYQGDEATSFLHDGKCYISTPAGIFLIDANSGTFLGRFDSPLPWPMILSVSSLGFIAHNEKSLVRLDSENLSAIESLPAPNGFSYRVSTVNPVCDKYYAISLSCDDKTLSPSVSGVLYFSYDSDFSGITCEPEISMLFMEAEDQSGEKIYFFTVSEPDINRLFRLGAIEIIEACCLRGDHTFGSGGACDPKHKGKIRLVIDREGLPDDVEERVEEWIGAITEYLKKMAIYPGAGERYRFAIDVDFK